MRFNLNLKSAEFLFEWHSASVRMTILSNDRWCVSKTFLLSFKFLKERWEKKGKAYFTHLAEDVRFNGAEVGLIENKQIINILYYHQNVISIAAERVCVCVKFSRLHFLATVIWQECDRDKNRIHISAPIGIGWQRMKEKNLT